MNKKEDMSSLFVAVIFIALGRSGRDTSLKQFLEDQCKAEWPVDDDEIRQDKECWRIASVVGVIVSICISWIYKDIEWVNLCKISVIAMALGFTFFLAGIPFYHVIKLPQGIFKKHLSQTCSSSSSSTSNNHHIYMDTILRDEDKDVITISNPTSRVGEVKKVLSTVPLLMTFLVYGLLQATVSVFFYEQVDYMEPRIGLISNVPTVIFAVIIKCTSFGVSYVYEKWFVFPHEERTPQHVMLIRIGAGLAIGPVCCIIAWRVEIYRLELHVKSDISASVAWLIPQFMLLGISEGLVWDGIEEFFSANVSKLLKKYGLVFAQFVTNVGHFISLALVLNLRSLFGDSLETSSLGTYYAILGYVCSVNFMIYCFVATHSTKQGGESSP